MKERNDLLASISKTIYDYRSGAIAPPTPAHVDRWVGQFEAGVQLPILREMDFVLKKTYFSLDSVKAFLRRLLVAPNVVGKDPCSFWRSINFLNIQGGGNSQTEMLDLFGALLKESCGFGIDACGGSNVYVYLDDAIFTGNRVRRDIEKWISEVAPARATVHIISIAQHIGGQHYARGRIQTVANSSKKNIDVNWWHAIELEDRKAYTATSDVLRPTLIPGDAGVQAYVQDMQHKPNLRITGGVGANGLFSSEAGRVVLEQEFLKAGVKIRGVCPHLGATQRPLGHMTLETLGFGSLIATFRNCPNNAPLALWAGDPWYPLFPRTTNTETAVLRMFSDLTKGH